MRHNTDQNNTPYPSEPQSHKRGLGTLVAAIKASSALVKLLLLLALVALIALGIGRWQYNKKHNTHISRTITQTITEVQQIQEFCTATYTNEIVFPVKRQRRMGTDELTLIVRGTVRAGFDLSRMEALPTSDTSIVIVLPKPEVLDVITNPSDYETFQESGHWSHKKVTAYKEAARQQILRLALAEGILKDARTNGISRLKLLFSGMGFTDIHITVKENDTTKAATPKEH